MICLGIKWMQPAGLHGACISFDTSKEETLSLIEQRVGQLTWVRDVGRSAETSSGSETLRGPGGILRRDSGRSESVRAIFALLSKDHRALCASLFLRIPSRCPFPSIANHIVQPVAVTALERRIR